MVCDQTMNWVADRFGMLVAELAIGLTPTRALQIVFIGILWTQRRPNRTVELNCPMCNKPDVGVSGFLLRA